MEEKPDNWEQIKLIEAENKKPKQPFFLIRFFKFIFLDIVNDWKFIFRVASGKEKVELKEKFRGFNKELYFEALKEYYWVFLLLALAFFCGMFFSAQHWQDTCNKFILDTILPNCTQYSKAYLNPYQNIITNQNLSFINISIS